MKCLYLYEISDSGSAPTFHPNILLPGQNIFYSTVTIPKVLASFLSGHQAIFFTSCLTQLHFFHFLDSRKAILLAVMACDYYMALFNPLCYTL
ncbi:unnamed protein product, partial [Natator depressus]